MPASTTERAVERRLDITRRSFLALAGLAGLSVAGCTAAQTIEQLHGVDPAGLGSLRDIDHLVFLMQENRSFDHYFGVMSGVRGFDDTSADLMQRGWRAGAGPDPNGWLNPFHLDTRSDQQEAEILNDPSHTWGVQHRCWNGGSMDGWLPAHIASDRASAPIIMGYYTRTDLPIHYGLADAFTVCDHYFCSVMGPTDPNRLYWISASLDPLGEAGGPVSGNFTGHTRPQFRWPTFPETLEAAGISWKVYNHLAPTVPVGDGPTGMLGEFAAFQPPDTSLYDRGRRPRYPRDFVQDIAAGTLPSVSWIVPSLRMSEHPAYPPALGAEGIMQVLSAFAANPALWERSAVIVSYDENGGFFDHVAPPVPPARTPGEFLSPGGAAAPIGLGFRVPCLVLSPYTRGCHVSSQVFDHTSQLLLAGRRFGVEVPNVTAWRLRTVGDLTSVFAGHRQSSAAVPTYSTAKEAAQDEVAGDAALISRAEHGHRAPLAIPPSRPPHQEALPLRTHI